MTTKVEKTGVRESVLIRVMTTSKLTTMSKRNGSKFIEGIKITLEFKHIPYI